MHSDLQPDSTPKGRALNRKLLFWALQCAGWLVFGSAMFAWGLQFWRPKDAAVEKAILVSSGFTLTIIFRFLYRRLRFRRSGHIATTIAVAVLCTAGAALWIEAQVMLFGIYCNTMQPGSFEVSPAPIGFGSLFYYGFVLLSWSLLYFGVNAVLDLEQERLRATRAEAMAQSARLRALQSQLEPHFLFNTLNAISTLVAVNDNKAANQMISRLSDFLRLTLDRAETPEITVAEELDFARRYLEIEQARFGDRLQVRIDAPTDVLHARVPALLLQPIVENAVKHGVLPRESGGSIAIVVRRDGESLAITVSDDGAAPAERPARNGIGLSNTAARLRELYGAEGSVNFAPSSAGGQVQIRIPLRLATHAQSLAQELA